MDCITIFLQTRDETKGVVAVISVHADELQKFALIIIVELLFNKKNKMTI